MNLSTPNFSDGSNIIDTNHISYKTWSSMRLRCNYSKTNNYKYYGGRGIKVCERWNNRVSGYVRFVQDMGPRPSLNHVIDRIDPNGNYEPFNCRWVTKLENSKNRKFEPPKEKIRKIGRTLRFAVLNALGLDRCCICKEVKNMFTEFTRRVVCNNCNRGRVKKYEHLKNPEWGYNKKRSVISYLCPSCVKKFKSKEKRICCSRACANKHRYCPASRQLSSRKLRAGAFFIRRRHDRRTRAYLKAMRTA